MGVPGFAPEYARSATGWARSLRSARSQPLTEKDRDDQALSGSTLLAQRSDCRNGDSYPSHPEGRSRSRPSCRRRDTLPQPPRSQNDSKASNASRPWPRRNWRSQPQKGNSTNAKSRQGMRNVQKEAGHRARSKSAPKRPILIRVDWNHQPGIWCNASALWGSVARTISSRTLSSPCSIAFCNSLRCCDAILRVCDCQA